MHLLWKNLVEDYGPVMKIEIPGLPKFVAFTSPAVGEAIYKATVSNPIRVGFLCLKKIRDEALNDYFEKKAGILIENNEEWWRVRSRVQTPMMKIKNVAKFLPQMDEISLEFVERISELQKQHQEMPENFLEELYRWALESIGVVALNRRLQCVSKLSPNSKQMELINVVNEMFEALCETELNPPFWKLFPTPAFKKLRDVHQKLLQLAEENIRITEEEMKSRGRSEDDEDLPLMGILLRTEGLTRKDVITMILDMLFAGIDTTSHTAGFTLYLLAKYPNAQETLHRELDRVLKDGKSPISENQLAQLSYLKSCVKESLRIFPLLMGHVRLLEKDTVLGGYLVPKGVQVAFASSVAGWDEKYFKRAGEFLPERWGRDQPLGSIHPYASLPFSYGPRMCIGRRIAEQELYTLLARVFHRYRVEYHHGEMDMVTRLVHMPGKPLRFKFVERSQ